MTTSTSLVFLYKLLNCFTNDIKIQPEKLNNIFFNQQESYSALLNLVCEYIFLIERLQNPGNIYIEIHNKRIKNCNDSIKRIFVDLFLFKFFFPVSLLNNKLLSTSTGLIIALGWVLEKSNILTSLSKYLLQYRTGELFLQFHNSVLDTISFYPSIQHTSIILPRKSLHISELIIPLKSEYSRIDSILRELSLTIELNARSEQQLKHGDNKNVENWKILTGLIKECGLVDLHYLQSKHLVEYFGTCTRNQIYAIYSLRSAISNVHQFWYLFNPANNNQLKNILEDTRECHEQSMSVPLSFQRIQVCFIKKVISSVIVVSFANNDKSILDKEQLGFFKHKCEMRLNGYCKCLASTCVQFNSKTKGLLAFYKL